MKTVWKSFDYLYKFLCILCVLILIVMSLSTLLQVLSRYLFPMPITWTEELSRRAMTWLLFIAAAAAYRGGAQVGIDFIIERFPDKLHKIISICLDAFIATFGAFMCWQGYILASKSARQVSSALRISMKYIYMIIPISGFLIIVFALEKISKAFIVNSKGTKEE